MEGSVGPCGRRLGRQFVDGEDIRMTMLAEGGIFRWRFGRARGYLTGLGVECGASRHGSCLGS